VARRADRRAISFDGTASTGPHPRDRIDARANAENPSPPRPRAKSLRRRDARRLFGKRVVTIHSAHRIQFLEDTIARIVVLGD